MIIPIWLFFYQSFLSIAISAYNQFFMLTKIEQKLSCTYALIWIGTLICKLKYSITFNVNEFAESCCVKHSPLFYSLGYPIQMRYDNEQLECVTTATGAPLQVKLARPWSYLIFAEQNRAQAVVMHCQDASEKMIFPASNSWRRPCALLTNCNKQQSKPQCHIQCLYRDSLGFTLTI